MKDFHVYLTYKSMKHPQKVTISVKDNEGADDARRLASDRYPNATIEGPSSVLEIKQFNGNYYHGQ